MNKYRYTDYYQLTKAFDSLYEKSLENKNFNRLMDIISSENNIKLAFRMIKANTGSQTSGVDGITIEDLKEDNIEIYVEKIKQKLNCYKPDKVRREYIPKDNGSKRPLGIPTMVDRLVQQSIKQVLEPICEAKFHPHSYGFRPNRSTKHAIARVNHLINMNGLHYAVDIDIKSFFDNVDHNKLIKQIFALGIKDRKLLAIIKEMLKAPIDQEGVPSKGTPQGGILSPLLANIVLNEMDWWINSQWENFKTKKEYKSKDALYLSLKRKTNLKQMFIVRYADDFKILCKNYNDARKIFYALKEWLKERLKLEVNEEKSKIINLRKKYSYFLGFKIKAVKKGKTRFGYVAYTYVDEKAVEKMQQKLKKLVANFAKTQYDKHLQLLNITIRGFHEYYKSATHVVKAFYKIDYTLRRIMYNRWKKIAVCTKKYPKGKLFNKHYKGYKGKLWCRTDVVIYPIGYIQHTPIMNFSQKICDYTIEGRKLSSKSLKNRTSNKVIELAKLYISKMSIEYNDNRVSRASMCNMCCEITGMELEVYETHCHHVIPQQMGGKDDYSNLRIVHKDIHILIHAVKQETIDKYLHLIKTEKSLVKLNKIREKCGLENIKGLEVSYN